MKREIFILKFSIILLFLIFAACPSFAARPLTTDDAGTVDPGRFEIEEGLIIDQPRGEDIPSSTGMGTSIKYGVLPNLDLGVEIPYSTTDPKGIGDATIKGKVRIVDESEIIPSVAVGVNAKLPNTDPDSGAGSKYTDYSFLGIFTKEIGPLKGNINLVYTVIGAPKGEESSDKISYGFAIVYPMNQGLNLMGEIFGEADSNSEDKPVNLQFGANLSLNDTFTLDSGIGIGLTETSSQYQGTIGLTVDM